MYKDVYDSNILYSKMCSNATVIYMHMHSIQEISCIV